MKVYLIIKVKECHFLIKSEKKMFPTDSYEKKCQKYFLDGRNIIPERSTEIQEVIMNTRKGNYVDKPKLLLTI